MPDSDYLNFALNLEYLEAAYYARGAAGAGSGSAANGPPVAFDDPLLGEFARSLMVDEAEHVRVLREALGPLAIAPPALDFRAGFGRLARAARLPRGFDPFADQISFFIGAFVFEDVGVTAYHGAVPYLQSKDVLTAAAGIQGTEAYHAGMIRSVLYRQGGRAVEAANAISAVRSELGGGAEQPLTGPGGTPIMAPTDPNGIAFARTPQEVLAIVYATSRPGARGGGFFPHGVNGAITMA